MLHCSFSLQRWSSAGRPDTSWSPVKPVKNVHLHITSRVRWCRPTGDHIWRDFYQRLKRAFADRKMKPTWPTRYQHRTIKWFIVADTIKWERSRVPGEPSLTAAAACVRLSLQTQQMWSDCHSYMHIVALRYFNPLFNHSLHKNKRSSHHHSLYRRVCASPPARR